MTLIWKDIDGQLSAVTVDEHGRETQATWAPQPGSQEAFLRCPIFECIYEGERGPGKTDALLMDFGQHVGVGFGKEWVGVLFRKTYPELEDVINKSNKWFPKIWPEATYNKAKHFWEWPEGEKLYFRHFEKPTDYNKYHGHAYPWIAWEELTTWPNDKCYTVMMSCSRSSQKGMPRKYRATTNPYGVGHNWVKARFHLPVRNERIVGEVIDFDLGEMDSETMTPKQIEGLRDMSRVAVHGTLTENKILLHAEPNYIMKLQAAARNPAELAAWLHGDWDITSGGMFDDIWNSKIHVIPNIEANQIPRSWRLDRAYDHGQSKPFSVGWWAESSGESIIVDGVRIGPVRGDIIRIHEWYGWAGTRNEGTRTDAPVIAEGIIEREDSWGLRGRVRKGPADNAIFSPYEGTRSVAGDMASKGVAWTESDKGPGSRMQGWEQIRKLMRGAIPYEDGTRDSKGLFVCTGCEQFKETVPSLPRDDSNLDDVDTDAEDHIADETRYRVRKKNLQIRTGSF